MNDAKTHAHTGLLARWVLFSGLGLGAGIASALLVADPIEKLVGMMLVTPVILLAAGSIFGGSQWLSIWRRHHIGWIWIGATGFAMAISMTLGLVTVEEASRALTGEPIRLLDATAAERMTSLFVIGAITGLGVGLCQWMVIRRHLRGSAWIVLTTIAFAIGFPSGAFAADLLPGGLGGLAGFVTFVCVTGFIVGAATARPARRFAVGIGNA